FFLLDKLLLFNGIVIRHSLKLCSSFGLKSVVSHLLQFSLCNTFWSIIDKLKSRFSTALLLRNSIRHRLAFVLLFFVCVSIHINLFSGFIQLTIHIVPVAQFSKKSIAKVFFCD